jgi:hypothetical protein
MTDTLSKVDSASNDTFVKATADEVKKGHRRASSMAADVYSIEDLGECGVARGRVGPMLTRWIEKEKKNIDISIETQKLGWYVDVASLCVRSMFVKNGM